MSSQKFVVSINEPNLTASTSSAAGGRDGDTEQCEKGCACCGMSGRGGKLRIALLGVAFVVVVILLVHGFATAG